MGIPDDFGETEIGDLDDTNAASTLTRDEFSLVCLVLVIGASRFGMLCGDKRNRIKQQILGFDITSGHVSFVMGGEFCVRDTYR